jgi:hypothetical protein
MDGLRGWAYALFVFLQCVVVGSTSFLITKHLIGFLNLSESIGTRFGASVRMIT